MVQYYAKFLANLATHPTPAPSVITEQREVVMRNRVRHLFRVVEDMLLQDMVLIIYDPELPLVIARGSSSYDLGAVLSHRTLRGKERTMLIQPDLCLK